MHYYALINDHPEYTNILAHALTEARRGVPAERVRWDAHARIRALGATPAMTAIAIGIVDNELDGINERRVA